MAVPNAPDVGAGEPAVYVNSLDWWDVDWVFSDPDPGDTQSAYAVRRRIDGVYAYRQSDRFGWQATEVDSEIKTLSVYQGTTIYDLASNQNKDHYYSFKVWDNHGDGPSAWSTEVHVYSDEAPQPTVIVPLGHAIVRQLCLVQWGIHLGQPARRRFVVSDSSYYVIDDGDIDYDSGWIDGDEAAGYQVVSCPVEGDRWLKFGVEDVYGIVTIGMRPITVVHRIGGGVGMIPVGG